MSSISLIAVNSENEKYLEENVHDIHIENRKTGKRENVRWTKGATSKTLKVHFDGEWEPFSISAKTRGHNLYYKPV